MTSQRYGEINSLADELLELPTNQRAAFLDRACAADRSLRSEVEALLEAHESQDGFLDAPVLELMAKDMAAEPPPNEFSGRVLGDYEILSRLGAGGSGEVWLAINRSLARQVALKLLSAKFVSDPNQILRFKQEARAASKLSHPNIVTIYEIGQSEVWILLLKSWSTE